MCFHKGNLVAHARINAIAKLGKTFHLTTLGPFPLTPGLHRVKLWMESVPNGNTAISKQIQFDASGITSCSGKKKNNKLFISTGHMFLSTGSDSLEQDAAGVVTGPVSGAQVWIHSFSDVFPTGLGASSALLASHHDAIPPKSCSGSGAVHSLQWRTNLPKCVVYIHRHPPANNRGENITSSRILSLCPRLQKVFCLNQQIIIEPSRAAVYMCSKYSN